MQMLDGLKHISCCEILSDFQSMLMQIGILNAISGPYWNPLLRT